MPNRPDPKGQVSGSRHGTSGSTTYPISDLARHGGDENDTARLLFTTKKTSKLLRESVAASDVDFHDSTKAVHGIYTLSTTCRRNIVIR